MNTILKKSQYLLALLILLSLSQIAQSALPTLSIPTTPFIKIPVTAISPSLQDLLKIPPTLPPAVNVCQFNYPVPEVFFTGQSEQKVNGVDYVYYSLTINNKEAYPDGMFTEAPTLPPCGANTNSARTWALIYDQNDNYIYGFCALGAASQLDSLWFSKKKTDPAPGPVHVILKDRLCNKEYKSAPVAVDQLPVVSGAPVISGIGLVPRTFINQTTGLATTGASDAITVKDSPFGSGLRFIGNIERLRSLGVVSYGIGYCDMAKYTCAALDSGSFNVAHWSFVNDPRTNYFWNSTTGKFVLQQDSPTEIYNDGTYLFRTYLMPSAILSWYFNNLLFDWSTDGTVKVPSGLYKVHLFGFNGPTLANLMVIPSTESTLVVKIDNTPPTFKINSISYKGSAVSSCSIVTLEKATDPIEFNITASDPDGYLLSYTLQGEYGDNQIHSCASETYTSYLAGGHTGPSWSGVSSLAQNCSNIPKSCAYSYHISGWDRAINGYNYIHYADYFKTLTIQVPLQLTIPITPILTREKTGVVCGK